MDKRLLTVPAIVLAASCSTRTSGYFAGPTVGREPAPVTAGGDAAPLAVSVSDTLLNCTFDNVTDAPFGGNCPFPVVDGGLQVYNYRLEDPVVLLSSAGLQEDGLVEARFEIARALPHAVAGLVLRAEDGDSFLLAAVNGRGQYTVQTCLNGLWTPVMGLDPFETSRLLPYDPPAVTVTAEVHGDYVDIFVNGMLIQVVRSRMPALGQVGVFVDGGIDAVLDRFTVVPFQ